MKLSREMRLALELATHFGNAGLTRVSGVFIPRGWTPGDPYVSPHTISALERRGLVKHDTVSHVKLCQNNS